MQSYLDFNTKAILTWFYFYSFNEWVEKVDEEKAQRIETNLRDMKDLKEKELLKYVNYDVDRVQTYVLFQKAFDCLDNEEEKQELHDTLYRALQFISEKRDQEWCLVFFKD